MADTMSIAEVLSEIRSTTSGSRPFALRFVRGAGKRQGSICMIPQAIKGHPQGTHSDPTLPPRRTSGKYLYKEHDTLPLIDLEKGGRFITVLISHIIQYNQYKVIH